MGNIKIVEQVKEMLPQNADVSSINFEAANIIVYTKNKKFFLDNNGIIRDVVNQIKKRVELRIDPSLTMDVENSEKTIKKIIGDEAGELNVIFDSQRSKLIVEAEKPGIAIGKSGENLREIKEKTLWVATVRRIPSIKSRLIENIRKVLYENSDYRKKFFHKVGERIYGGKIREGKTDWVRVSFMGAARQVGRSCFLLQTPESRILMDCGINVAAKGDDRSPYFELPEFDVAQIDAIVLSHAHVDHCSLIPLLFKYGYRGPVYCTAPTRDVAALLCLDVIGIGQKEGEKELYSSSDVKEMVKHCICLDYEVVTDITPDIRLTFYNAGHNLGSAMCHFHIGEGMHNFLYSLDSETPVNFLDSENNVYFEPIGNVVDSVFKSNINAPVINLHGAEEIPNLLGLKTTVFNPKTLKTEVKSITSFIRHPINEDLYEVITNSGKRAKVTKSHSVFTMKDGNVLSVKLSDIMEGDYIIAPKKIPNLEEKEKIINLLEHRNNLRLEIDDVGAVKELVSNHMFKISALKTKKERYEAIKWLNDHYKYGLYKKDISKKYNVSLKKINRIFKLVGVENNLRVGHTLLHKFKLDKDFARFLGYYVAEGYTRKDGQTVQIANLSKYILEDCLKIIDNKFGIKGDLREKDGVVLFNSKQLKYLLCNVLGCGVYANEKRVPREVLGSSKDVVGNFLNGYFSGDGGIRSRNEGREIFFSSKNKELVQDVSYMLLKFGIVPKLGHNNYNDMYWGTIYSNESINKFLNEIGISNKGLGKLVSSLESMRKIKGGFDSLIPLVSLSKKAQISLTRSNYKDAKSISIKKLSNMDISESDSKLLNSDLFLDKVVSMKKVKPSSKYVYDFKIEGYENFLGGEGFLFLHNTGDMNYEMSNLLAPAVTRFPRLETVMMEATSGGKDDVFETRQESEDYLMKIVNDTVERKGKILMPVLGLGRSQELMIILEKAMREGRIPKIPIYLQGMVWDVNAIHTAYPDFFNNRIKQKIFHKDENPFLSEVFKRVGSQKEMKEIMEGNDPCIIMATSGMMAGGASVEYFKHMAPNSRHSLVLTCYQGEGSLGRRLQNGEKEIFFQSGNNQEVVKVKMGIYPIRGFSGHSDRAQLMNWARRLNPKPKRVITVHGESSKCIDLASSIHKEHRIETYAPKAVESIRLR